MAEYQSITEGPIFKLFNELAIAVNKFGEENEISYNDTLVVLGNLVADVAINSGNQNIEASLSVAMGIVASAALSRLNATCDRGNAPLN
jgi:hypothetical protein